MLLHPNGDPNNNLIGPLLTDYPVIGYDEHASWLNIPANEDQGLDVQNQDVYPVLITTAAVPPTSQYTLWGEDEIIGISANPADAGNNVHWRFGQTGNSGTSSFYTCANAKGTVAEDGRGIVFTSDMSSDGSTNPLGVDSQGRPRCDVFWMELK